MIIGQEGMVVRREVGVGKLIRGVGDGERARGGSCIPLDGRSACGSVSVGCVSMGNGCGWCVCVCGGQGLVNVAWHRKGVDFLVIFASIR